MQSAKHRNAEIASAQRDSRRLPAEAADHTRLKQGDIDLTSAQPHYLVTDRSWPAT